MWLLFLILVILVVIILSLGVYICRTKNKLKQGMVGSSTDSQRSEEEVVQAGQFEQLEGGLLVPAVIWSRLYNYQKVGVQWMFELHQQRCGGILGDEMGLGKTIQVITLLSALSFSRTVWPGSSWRGLGSSIIVCPTTLLHQWVAEFHKWWPPLRGNIYCEN